MPLALSQTGSSIAQFNCLFAIYLNLIKNDLQDIMKKIRKTLRRFKSHKDRYRRRGRYHGAIIAESVYYVVNDGKC